MKWGRVKQKLNITRNGFLRFWVRLGSRKGNNKGIAGSDQSMGADSLCKAQPQPHLWEVSRSGLQTPRCQSPAGTQAIAG